MYKKGDKVIYLMHKHTVCPKARRPVHLRPQPSGEFYDYDVEKQWAVSKVHLDTLEIKTRTGKTRTIGKSDPRLRKATSWEKFWYTVLRRWPASV
jgi:hypothetical protein